MALYSPQKQEHHAASPIFGLPQTVLVNILKKLPQHDRLAYAALVCKSWAAAAVPATTVLALSKLNPAAATGLSSWVQQHGRDAVEIEAIRVLKQQSSLTKPVKLQLFAAGLANLDLLYINNCALEIRNSSSSPAQGVPAAVVLPALRSLALDHSTVYLDTLSSLECPMLTALQLLHPPAQRASIFRSDLLAATCNTGPTVTAVTPAGSQQQFDRALSAFLQRLPGLLRLHLSNHQMSDTALAQLSCLQQLQQCSLCCPRTTPAVLGNLGTSLTCLTLYEGQRLLQVGWG